MLSKFALIVGLFLVFAASASAGTLPAPMLQALRDYGADYGTYQEWVFVDVEHAHGDSRHAVVDLDFLANPAPGADKCFVANPTTDDGCPTKWYTGDFEFYMDVEARVVRCGPGWYVVSTPLDQHKCHADVDYLRRW